MELINCPHHSSSYCLLKTGTKPGPTKGASFYVCANCQFNVHTKLPPSNCIVHTSHNIELQSIVSVKNVPEQLRRYFRCPGRMAGETWCGHEAFAKPTQVAKDCKEKSSIKSDHTESQSQLHNNKKDTEKNSFVKPSKEKSASSSDQNLANQPSNVNIWQPCVEDNSICIVSDDDDDGDCREKEISDQEKTTETQMEISFANLNKSRLLSTATSSEMNISFENKSFRNYRESPRPSGKDKPGNLFVKPNVTTDSDDDSDSSDFKEDVARKKLEQLKISSKESKKMSGTSSTTGISSEQELSVMGGATKSDKELPNATGKSEMTAENRANQRRHEGPQKSNSAAGLASSTPNTQVTGLEKKDVVSQHLPADDGKLAFKVSAQSLSSLLSQRDMMAIELQKIQTNLRSINMHSLPDGGQRFLHKIKTMQNNVQAMDDEIKKAQLGSQDNSSKSVSSSGPTGASLRQLHMNPVHGKPDLVNSTSVLMAQSSIKSDITNYRTSSSADVPQPVLQSQQQQHHFPNQFMHLPQHLQQLFAANPQAMTLYGGRMTAQQLREIGSITTEAIDKLHKQLESCPTESTECSDPHGLKVELKSHQRQALAWLAWREKQVPPGGILADDMGLGKTLTTISHILRHKVARSQEGKDEWLSRDKQVEKLEKAVKKSGATLIVAPASLIHQWAKEIERRCRAGLLKFLIYHGPNREKSIQKLIDCDIVLTTYTIVSKEVGTDKQKNAEDPVRDDEDEGETESKASEKSGELPLLLKIGWERIVLDEAHNIKNHKSLTAQSVCRLRAVYRWALTGTPIQNDLLDMYSLLRFLRFSPFDEYKVWKKHIDSGKGDTKRLNTIVKALLLRRTKDQTTIEGKPLVSLPSKTSTTIKVELSPEEKAVYDKLFKKTQSKVQEYVQRHAEKERDGMVGTKLLVLSHSEGEAKGAAHGGAFHGDAFHGAGQIVGATNAAPPNQVRNTGSQILVSLLRLRQCCSHLNLMKSHLDATNMESDGIELTLEEQIKGMVLDEVDRECAEVTSKNSPEVFLKSSLSTKLKCLMEKIVSIQSDKDSAGKDKSVIVSQWTQMLEIVAYHLDKAGVRYSTIQGDIPAKKRMEIVDDFNLNSKGIQVLLLSLQAGGVGLNLIGGNHLFMLDIHWNPALEEQACDRIYRMGQKKDVFIYRFLCKDTIEEKIVALQETKRSLAKSVLSGAGASRQKLTLSDLRSLFGL